MEKYKYKGTFNWYGQDFTLYRWAKDEAWALVLFCRALSKLVDYSFRAVYDHFYFATFDIYRIERI